MVVKKRKKGSSRGKKRKEGPFYAPFAKLGKALRRAQAQAEAKSREATPGQGEGSAAAGEPGDEAELFQRAMAGVEPLSPEQRDRLPRRPAPKGPRLELLVDEDLEVMARLADLVSGEGEFDLRYSDQYVQGAAPGVGPALMERLAAGAFPVQDYLDLHGLTSESAMQAVESFLSEAVLRGLRHVLIVHGKGHRSPGGEPVLKTMLVEALSTRRMQKRVLAFCSARAADGGTGAMYVLLRRWSGPGRW